MSHQRTIGDAVKRSLGRARAVETWEHLPDAALDAYLLAKEYETVRQEAERLRQFRRNVLNTVSQWR